LSSAGGVGNAPRLLHHQVGCACWVRSVLEECLQASWKHLLEANDQHTVGGTVRNHVSSHVETSRTGRAIVVDIINGNTSHAELVEDALTACRIAVAVACDTLVNVVVVDVRVEHSLDTGLKAELWVVDLAAGLDELRHAYAEDVDGLFLADHGGGCEVVKLVVWCGRQGLQLSEEIQLIATRMLKLEREILRLHGCDVWSI
jgi:hypothetical protein